MSKNVFIIRNHANCTDLINDYLCNCELGFKVIFMLACQSIKYKYSLLLWKDIEI